MRPHPYCLLVVVTSACAQVSMPRSPVPARTASVPSAVEEPIFNKDMESASLDCAQAIKPVCGATIDWTSDECLGKLQTLTVKMCGRKLAAASRLMPNSASRNNVAFAAASMFIVASEREVNPVIRSGFERQARDMLAACGCRTP